MLVAGKEIEARDPAPGADGARRRHPHHHGDAAPVGRRHHRHHQGQLPDPHQLPGHLQDRQPHHPRRAGRRAAARPGRHAVHGRRRARSRRVHGPFVSDDEVEDVVALPQGAGRARLCRGGHRGRGGLGGEPMSLGDRRRRRGRRRRPLRPGGGPGRARGQGLDQLRPAPPADRLQPRRPDHRADGEGRRGQQPPTMSASARC